MRMSVEKVDLRALHLDAEPPRVLDQVGAPRGGFWREVLNTDAREYGGGGVGNLGGVEAEAEGAHGRPHSLVLEVPPLVRANGFQLELGLAVLATFLVGLCALRVLLAFLGRGAFRWCSYYCVVVGTAALLWLA